MPQTRRHALASEGRLLLEALGRGLLCTQVLYAANWLLAQTVPAPPLSVLSVLLWASVWRLWRELEPSLAGRLLAGLALAAYAALCQGHLVALVELGHPILFSDVRLNAGAYWGDYVFHYARTRWAPILLTAAAWTLLMQMPPLLGAPKPRTAILRLSTAACLASAVGLFIVYDAGPRAHLRTFNVHYANLDLASKALGYAVDRAIPHHRQRYVPPLRKAATDRPETPPFNVLVILHESWGTWNDVDSGLFPNLQALLETPGRQSVALREFFAVSTSTTLALPTLLSGVHWLAEGDAALTRPLVWHLATAMHLPHAWVTSSPWNASFLSQLLHPGPTSLIAGDHLPGGPVNESSRDDLEAALAARRWLLDQDPEKPLLLFYYTNAMHFPCQHASPHWQPPPEATRCRSASRLADHASGIVLDTLRETGRLENTVVFAFGDHGEVETPHYVEPQGLTFDEWRLAMSEKGVWRLSSSLDVYLRTPAWVSLPAAFPGAEDAARALRAWTDQPATTPDLGATLFDLLGAPLPQKPYFGRSFLGMPPARPRTLVSLNSPAFVDPDHNWVTFGLIQPGKRLLYNDLEGFRLYDADGDPRQEHNRLCQATAAERLDWHRRIDAIPQLRHLALRGPHRAAYTSLFACDDEP